MQVPLSETLRQFDESDSVLESVGGWELSAARTTLFGASARAPEPLASPSAPRSPLVPPKDASSSLEVLASSPPLTPSESALARARTLEAALVARARLATVARQQSESVRIARTPRLVQAKPPFPHTSHPVFPHMSGMNSLFSVFFLCLPIAQAKQASLERDNASLEQRRVELEHANATLERQKQELERQLEAERARPPQKQASLHPSHSFSTDFRCLPT